MSAAAALIREVFAAGGQIRADGADLVLSAPRPLPDDLLAQTREHKRAILDALAHSDDVALWWRVSILEPGGRTIEVDTPSGYTLADWKAYADRYHGPGCAVTAIAGLPKFFRALVNLDEALVSACEGVAGITPPQFRVLLSPEDIKDIEAGASTRRPSTPMPSHSPRGSCRGGWSRRSTCARAPSPAPTRAVLSSPRPRSRPRGKAAPW